jgi:hypothetical protein
MASWLSQGTAALKTAIVIATTANEPSATLSHFYKR